MGKQRTGRKDKRNGLADPTKLKVFAKKVEDGSAGSAEDGDELLQVNIQEFLANYH